MSSPCNQAAHREDPMLSSRPRRVEPNRGEEEYTHMITQAERNTDRCSSERLLSSLKF